MMQQKNCKENQKSNLTNNIKLYEAQETQFALFLVLEYCQFDVKSMMKIYFNNKLPEDLVQYNQILSIIIVILKQLVNGLHYLHKNNIIHRDLKLDNIGVVIQPEDLCKLTTSNKNLYESIFKNASYKLLDLGLAKQFINQTKTVTFAGTEVNMAPEVLERKPYSFEADIYSLGVCLYQMATGEYPYYDKLHQKEQFELIQQQDGNFEVIQNKILRNFIQQMLKYNVDERLTFQQLYQSPYIYNSKEVIPSLLERSLIKNQEFYDMYQKIDNNQLIQNYSNLKIQSFAQIDQSQLSKQQQNSYQHVFFEKINKFQIPNQSTIKSQENIQNQQIEEMQFRISKQKSQIGKPKQKHNEYFENLNQQKNMCILIENICEGLLDLILEIPKILNYYSFKGEFQIYLQYFANLGKNMANQLKNDVNPFSFDNSDNQQYKIINDSLLKLNFPNVEDIKICSLSKYCYLLRTKFNQIDSLKEIKEESTLDNSKEDFLRNNTIIFRQIVRLLQSFYYQENQLDKDEYKELNQFNCNLYIILIKLTTLEAAIQQKFLLSDDFITLYSPQNFANNPDLLCSQLGEIMEKYQIQYSDKQ